MTRRFVVRTFGCQMNEHDSERIAGLLEHDGMEAVTNETEADVVVLNTCCIRENADRKLYGTLGTLKAWKDAEPTRQIVVAGCLAQKDRDIVRDKAPWVDVVLGTHNVHRTVDLLDHARTSGPITEILDEAVVDDYALFPSALPVKRETSYRSWVTIQIGCDNTCAYCIVPAVRGKEISRPFDQIVDEVRALVASGVNEIFLLGQNVNSYGRDLSLASRRAGDETVRIAPQFAALLRAVGDVPGVRRVRYMSPHPKDMREDTLLAMAETAAVCEHLHYPLQSGSDAVLPDLAVTTDVIVGFPGETEADFERTMEVAAAAEFDSAYAFIFSPREGTAAAEMVDKFCDAGEMGERYERLKVVLDRTAVMKHRERIGRIEEVVVEGSSKKNPDLRLGTYARVEIIDAARFHLSGRLVEVISLPTHRTRLAVASA
ncbi:MAG: MiaB/RimO family radical SAM methylthiotransferase [Acidimicrobiia bacterium]|nr:MiaB/RimO family radical SAM methylthiotransferase [Acidimicrobiia bacterium]